MRRAAILLALSACGGTRHHDQRAATAPTCGPPVVAAGEAPARQVIQAQGVTGIEQLAISASGVLASLSGEHIDLWDVASGRLLGGFTSPTPGTRGIAWDGDVAVAVGYGTSRVAMDGSVLAKDKPSTRTTSDGGWEEPAALLIEAPGGARSVTGWWYHSSDNTRSELRFDVPLAGSLSLAPPSGWRATVVPRFDRWVMSLDGQHLVGWSNDSGAVAIWTLGEDVAPGVAFAVPGTAGGVAPAPDGSKVYVSAADYLASGKSTPGLYVVDAADPTHAPRTEPIDSAGPLIVSPDGAHLYVGESDRVRSLSLPDLAVTWSVATGLRFDALKGALLGGLPYALASDGARVIVGYGDGALLAFDAVTGRERSQLGWSMRPTRRLRFLDDDRLAVIGPNHLTVWSVTGGAPVVQMAVDGVVDVRMAGDDLVSVRNCNYRFGFDRWRKLDPPDDLVTAQSAEAHLCGDAATVAPGDATFLPAKPGMSGEIVVARDQPDTLWTDGAQAQIDWSGPLVRLVGQQSGVLDLRTGTVATISSAHLIFPPTLDEGVVVGLVTASEGDRDFVAPRLYDPRTGKVLATVVPPAELDAPPFNPERGGLSSGARVAVHHGVDRVAVAAETWIAELGLDGKTDWEIPAEHDPTAIAYASDDAVIVGGRDGSLQVVRGGALVGTGSSTGGAIDLIEVAPDGKVAVTRSFDGAIRIWDLATAQLRGTLVEFSDDEYLAYLPDGSFTGTGEAASRVAWVFDQPTEAFAFEQFTQFERPDAVRAVLRGDVEPPLPAQGARPPSATIAAPARGDRSVQVDVSAQSATRVDRVRVYADGRPVAEGPVCAASGHARLDVPLLPGTNRLTAVAYDDRGQSSNEVGADVTATAAATAPALWIVAVGVSRYPHLDDADQLAFADDDAQGLAVALTKHAKPRYASVHEIVLTDAQVTHDALLAALRGLDQMAPDDLAIVLLAGHGAKPSDSDDMRFLTSEATFDADAIRKRGIGWSDIAAALSQAKGRVLVLLDACHAGHVSQEVVVPNDALAAQLAGASRAGVVVLAASKGRQLSYEPGGARAIGIRTESNPDTPGAEHGLFTAALLATLDDPAADRDGDGALTLSELVAEVQTTVDTETRGLETPWLVRKEVIGDFALFDAAK